MTTVLLAGVSAITSAIRIARSRLGAKSGSNGSGAIVGSGRNERSEVMPCLLDGGWLDHRATCLVRPAMKCRLSWWARQDSNLRPWGYEPRALPLSYRPEA